MGDALTQIKCGQIFILSDNKFALLCEFCDREDFYALDVFRSHIKLHFPDSEDEVCISSDSDCEFVPPDLPNTACGSPATAASGENLIERECFPSKDNEIVVGSIQKNPHRSKQKRRIPTISSTDMKGSDNISQANIKDGSQTTKTYATQPKIKRSIRCEAKEELESTLMDGYECSTSTEGQTYKCQICSKTFAARNALMIHIKLLHTKDLRHACSLCKKRFLFPYQLEAHIREKHLPDNDPRRYFLCNLCYNQFKSFSVWKCHKPCNIRNIE